VRTCDGYFFPVTYNASSRQLRTDEQVCHATYGQAAAAELFVARGDNIADARSLNGKRYGDEPYAFQYRRAFNPQCAAQLHSGVAAVMTDAASPTAGEDAVLTLVAIPQLRPRHSEDPETLANRRGRLAARWVPQIADDPTRATDIRVVGAAYYNLILQEQAKVAARTSPPGDEVR
jgi:hypothetical protein